MTATLYRDRSRGNCTYYRLTAPASFSYMTAIPLVSVSNSDSMSFIHVYRKRETMVLPPFGMTPVEYRDLLDDILETESRMKNDLSRIKGMI